MTKIYVAFYDTDNGAREEWNTFYTPWVASTSKIGAKQLAQAAIKKAVIENILNDYDVDLDTTTIDEIDDEELRKEVREEYNRYIKGYIVEIQEGELG